MKTLGWSSRSLNMTQRQQTIPTFYHHCVTFLETVLQYYFKYIFGHGYCTNVYCLHCNFELHFSLIVYIFILFLILF